MSVAGPFYTSSGSNGFGTVAVGSISAAEWVAYTVKATSSNNETRIIVRDDYLFNPSKIDVLTF